MLKGKRAVVTGSTSGIGLGITANAICPGWVRTPLVERQIDVPEVLRGFAAEDYAFTPDYRVDQIIPKASRHFAVTPVVKQPHTGTQ